MAQNIHPLIIDPNKDEYIEDLLSVELILEFYSKEASSDLSNRKTPHLFEFKTTC